MPGHCIKTVECGTIATLMTCFLLGAAVSWQYYGHHCKSHNCDKAGRSTSWLYVTKVLVIGSQSH